ncbi:unnamed protein product [Dracunculus medinensis]|uniref:Exonuclease domain-containing protein n=1 Tax=Dracunculus medinensis TaxID=318479 RepID=A0A158Q5E2_DRAME|nr:unnamed protein product [Dracunculus medinensis]
MVMDIRVKLDFPAMDYNSRFSGLTKNLVKRKKVTKLFCIQARERFLEFVNSETILTGHSLESDPKALRIVHQKIVDTSDVFPHERGLQYKEESSLTRISITNSFLQFTKVTLASDKPRLV